MKIGNIKIGLDNKPFIIAEMSGNHNQSLDRAIAIVKAAAKSGAHALKLQTYKPDTITLNINKNEFVINDKESLWNGKTLYNLYKEAYTPWEWHETIIKEANQLGMLCFSSPFDNTAVDFLEELNVPAYKIASFENVHIPLIRKVSSTGKPIIVSTGMASIADIDKIVKTLRESGCKDYLLLKCTSTYPASPKDSNILTIPHMRELFKCEIGLSDHTMGLGTAIAAISHGATVIEKHFTLNRADGGVDSDFSMEPDEMSQLVVESERAWKSLGIISYGPTKKEKSSMIFRRSLYIAEDLLEGEILDEKNLRIVRPGYGLDPYYYDILIGQSIKKNVKKGTPMSWDLIL
jgi:pseudaminic acid synthase